MRLFTAQEYVCFGCRHDPMPSPSAAQQLAVGSWVHCPREEGDEYEACEIIQLDAASMSVSLRFSGGFVAAAVPITRIRLEPAPSTTAAAAKEDGDEEPRIVEDDGYFAAAALPTPPAAAELEADPEAKYRFVAAYKAAGNELFKAGKYAWAIRTYTGAVDALSRHCYPSRERMLWDYFARVPCAQCYSNAALCAIKLADHAHAAALCEHAMECRPEDGDLTKVLLRHGQAVSEKLPPRTCRSRTS